MKNKLSKSYLTEYTAEVKEIPPYPSYEFTRLVFVPGEVKTTVETVKDKNGNLYYVTSSIAVPGHYENEIVKIPGYAGNKGVPAKTKNKAVTGWNAGANSKSVLIGDGYVEFKISPNPISVVVGLSSSNRSTLPTEQEFAFYFHKDNVIEIIECGQIDDYFGNITSADTVYRIERSNGVVTYKAAGVEIKSQKQYFGPLVLDVSLYANGDYVYDPVVKNNSGGSEIYFELKPLLAIALADDAEQFADAKSDIGPMNANGIGHTKNELSYFQEDFSLPRIAAIAMAGGDFLAYINAEIKPIEAEASGKRYEYSEFSLPALNARASDRKISEVQFDLLRFSVSANGNMPFVDVASIEAVIPSIVARSSGTVGGKGSGSAILPSLKSALADRKINYVKASIPALNAFTFGAYSSERSSFSSSLIICGSAGTSDRAVLGGIRSKLSIGSIFSLAEKSLDSIVSVLIAKGEVLSTVEYFESVTSRLSLVGRFGTRAVSLIDRLAPVVFTEKLEDQKNLQVSVTMQSWAPTVYTDMDFDSLTSVDGHLFATRQDGIYEIGLSGEEDEISGFVDFGQTRLGAQSIKRIESVFLDIDTDAKIYLEIEGDGNAYSYEVESGVAKSRAKIGRGLAALNINTAMTFEGATELTLNSVDYAVGASKRNVKG